MTRRALFPVSVSNQRFSSKRVSTLIPFLFDRYDEIVFIVADHLQLYNKAMQVAELPSLSRVLWDFREKQQYASQRRRWLERLRRRLDPGENGPSWRILGVDDLTDSRYSHIFRNVMLAFYALPVFRRDVVEAAESHATLRQDKYPLELRQNLSVGYLLEELALSVRVRVLEKIWDEYYDGCQASVIMKFYAGAYPVSVFDLAEEETDTFNTFRFFRATGINEDVEWREYTVENSFDS